MCIIPLNKRTISGYGTKGVLFKHHRKFRRSLTNRTILRPNLFINPSDHMGLDVLINGCWDQFLTDSIRAVSANNRNDVFIDIGANIGLISTQVEDTFGKIIAVEPNPIAFGVLQANALTHISESKLSLRNCGLGNEMTSAQLEIPAMNLGGAFVRGPENRLSEEELRRKEGGKMDITKTFDISIVSAHDFFCSVDSEITDDQSRVVIKVDVEGMEEPIIRALLDSKLWSSREVICFFETWSSELKEEILSQLKKSALIQPKNELQWRHASEISNLETSTELCIWSPKLPDQALVLARI